MEHKSRLWDKQQGNKQWSDKTMQVIPRNAANEQRRSMAEQTVAAGTVTVVGGHGLSVDGVENDGDRTSWAVCRQSTAWQTCWKSRTVGHNAVGPLGAYLQQWTTWITNLPFCTPGRFTWRYDDSSFNKGTAYEGMRLLHEDLPLSLQCTWKTFCSRQQLDEE